MTAGPELYTKNPALYMTDLNTESASVLKKTTTTTTIKSIQFAEMPLELLIVLYFFPGWLYLFQGFFIPVWREIYRSSFPPVTIDR